ncbi:MAG TPA: (Fe-S)-binding protein [Solirubrobacteraceae bacterium]|nr:(Fe-S)-binding protein [Solirubrobacteraceae bacterium]
MSHIVFPILWAVGLIVFAGLLVMRARLLVAARPAARFDRIGLRLKRMTIDGLGQRKFLSGEQPSGIMHALIFWGFVVLMLQVVTLFGRAFDTGWNIPGFGPDQVLGPPFFIVRDLVEATVIVGVLYMLYRRLIAHTPRLFGVARGERRYHDAPHWEGVVILIMILLIMVGGLLYDAGWLVAQNIHGNERDFAPLTAAVAAALGGVSRSTARTLAEVGWWLHCVTILVFLNLLPLSKHFHIITAIPNVFFEKLPPAAVDRPLAITQVPAAPVAALDPPPQGLVGIASLSDLSWKQVLDAFTCTECGRCTSVCPAAASGTMLAPRQLILDLRDRLYHRAGLDPDGPLIASDVLWSCTTCMACVEACPVDIEHVPTIVDLRRSLIDQGDMDPLLQQTLENYGKQGNCYGKSSRMRARWTKALDFKIPDARKEPVKYVWFVGDFASFDERVQLASQAVARILHDAGVSFGLLYEGERNAGNDVRRIGEEGLFELLVEQNMAALGEASFAAIFTTDPHSLNTLRNEYPKYGLDKPVYHYTELLAELVSHGVITLSTPLSGTRVTYHDPCYLARYNRITEAPRTLIEATGATLVEMPRNGINTFCCGAGGGRIWMGDDEVIDERPSEQRIREAQALEGGIDYFLVSCPKDLAMYSDAAKTVGAEFEVAELTALVEHALGRAVPAPDASPPAPDAPAPDASAPAPDGAPDDAHSDSSDVSSSATSNRSATAP